MYIVVSHAAHTHTHTHTTHTQTQTHNRTQTQTTTQKHKFIRIQQNYKKRNQHKLIIHRNSAKVKEIQGNSKKFKGNSIDSEPKPLNFL